MPFSSPPGGHQDSLPAGFWAAASSVQERLTAPSAPADPPDPKRATARLARWRALAAFRGPEEHFTGQLRAVGVTAPALHRLLGEDHEALAARLSGRPGWADRVRSARPGPDRPDTPPLPGLLRVAEPLVRQAQDRLRSALRALGPFPAELDGLGEALLAGVPVTRLAVVLKPTMILEINLARVQGRLASGATSTARYQLYVDSLAEPGEQHRLWTRYPVLARCVTELLDDWVADRTRFARHLRDDLEALCEDLLCGVRPGGVAAVGFGQGDVHRRGSSVCRVDFHDAPPVFYKPRSLAVDEQFGRLVHRFNQDGPHTLRTPRTLTRQDHGWAECVSAQPCANARDVAGFYWRTGALLALVHALRGTDFHQENIMAVGEHPVLVDLEALLHPRAPRRTSRNGAGGPQGEPEEPALAALRESVRATALLPTKVVLDGAPAGAPVGDYSGLDGADGQPSITPVPVEKNPGTDEVHIVWEHVRSPGAQNRPRLPDGTPARAADHLTDVLAGFRHGYDWISARRTEILAPGGLLEGFAGTPVRFLPRPSFVYGKVLTESMHPDFLRDALDRECSTARLCGERYAGPAGEAVVRAEMDAVLRGDIPLFEALPGSRDLLLDDGRSVPGFFDEPALGAVRRRIEAMGPEDRELQERIIAGSFVGGVDVSLLEQPPAPADARRRTRTRSADPAELVAAATSIGDRVRRLATVREGRIGWIAPQPVAYGVWDLAPLDADLYSGLSGIGLFLARLGLISGHPRFTSLALDVADEVVRRVRASATADAGAGTGGEKDIGAFGAWMGPLYFLAHLDRLLGGTPHLAAVREPVLAVAERALDGTKTFDVVGGSAGCALALLAVVEAGQDPDGRAAALARRTARHLVTGAVPGGTGRGLAWEHHHIDSAQPLTGFAHGAAGIVTALARLADVAPDEGCAEAVAGGLAYETEAFDPEAGNWPDFRAEALSPFRSLWCHGAAGIGMSRLDLIGRPATAGLERQLAADALAALRPGELDPAGGPDTGAHRLTGRGSDSMCHGDLGNLELVLLAERGGRAEPGRLMRQLGEKLDAAAESDWVCGSPTRAETPGLLTGLSGVGHQLLRFACPDEVPSVLLLHPPHTVPTALQSTSNPSHHSCAARSSRP
ncbi:type 2 lanthipeptide synthetase LanM family protein [Streptomyces durmitorensis]|uniref:Type 2 lanthipeptide synthetase LanM family protein n=1 Tax=Streptomyces durmitorensis TaxID=319947 RepID=A0ABY4Q881_9ACTN|nr:type 2 lanthipeptide synthetase LanM family protein [Streptomyces durmitorensis]UQT61942.1 type 2 lanthipeptide synthetase LanM family protein [Streptomyces durmitorensis]